MEERRARRWFKRGAVVAASVALIGGLALALLGFEGLSASEAEPLDPATGRFVHAAFGRVLAAHVHDDGVDYPALARDGQALRRYVATLETVGPESTPARFESEDARLAYYLNAYNALVLFAVADKWPIESVQDVHGLVEPTDGFGFFYALFFRLDGRWTNLWALEHDVLRDRFEDARIHGAIVCASESCPDLRAEAYTAERVDAQLDAQMRRFTSSAEHVRVDDEGARIVLSAVFDWFREDFERDARRLTGDADAGVLDYVARFADDGTREALGRAREAGYEVVHAPYDWSVNRASTGMAMARGRRDG